MTTTMPMNRPQVRGQFAKIYAGVWALLATLAIAYMTVLAVQPSLLGAYAPALSEPETNEGQRTAARFATDISGLRQSVGDIQRDMASLRSVVTTSASRDKEFSERLTAVEERVKSQVVAETAAAIAPAKSVAQRQAEARAQKAADKAATIVQTLTPAAPPVAIAQSAGSQSDVSVSAPSPRVTILNTATPPANPIATGSIPAPAALGLPAPPAQGVPAPPAPIAVTAQAAVASFGPGAVKASAPAGPSAVELASGPSLDALRLNWSLLAERHSASLKDLEARYMNAGEGKPFQLVAGPIATPEEAARVCAQLKAKRVTCRVTGFSGNAL